MRNLQNTSLQQLTKFIYLFIAIYGAMDHSVKAAFVSLSLLLLMSFPVAMLCLGFIHRHDCPMQPWIPMYLLIGGAGGVVLIILIISLVNFVCHVETRSNCISRCVICITVLYWMLFGINIAGSVLVFSHWRNWDKVRESGESSCEEDMYEYAFAYLILYWISFPIQGGCCSSFLSIWDKCMENSPDESSTQII